MSLCPTRSAAPWRVAPVKLVTPRRRKLAGIKDYFCAVLGVLVVAIAFIWASEEVRHWYLIPVSICGVLAGVDVVRWVRGRLDIFDPLTIIGLLAFYGFFATPILHVVWDRYGVGYDLIVHGDERVWLGWMAWLNAAGLIVYRLSAGAVFWRVGPVKSRWNLNRLLALPVFTLGLLASFLAIAYLLVSLGGIEGIVDSYESHQREVFVGTGWLLVFAWPFSALSMIAILTFVRADKEVRRKSLIWALMVLAALGVAHFLLMGWRGSRSATVWAAFWIAGILHYRFHKFSPRLVALGTMALVGFMYFYGFYKEAGTRGFEVVTSPQQWLNPEGYKRDLKGLLLNDLARADIQSFLLYSLMTGSKNDYDYRYGLTYLGGLAVLIPRNIWPDRPEFKVEAGTEAQYGKATIGSSSRVYGLGGEAMLNFGPLGVPVAYAVFGGLLGWYRRKFLSLPQDDSRLYLAPLMTILFVTAFVGDMDNVVFGAVSRGALVSLCIVLASKARAFEPHA